MDLGMMMNDITKKELVEFVRSISGSIWSILSVAVLFIYIAIFRVHDSVEVFVALSYAAFIAWAAWKMIKEEWREFAPYNKE